jgi:hypothetical protein
MDIMANTNAHSKYYDILNVHRGLLLLADLAKKEGL